MHTTISANGFDRWELESDLRKHAKRILGRLRHNIAHAELALKKEDDEDVGGKHTCSLRLRLHGAGDVLILARGAGVGEAITGAFRRTRQELLRRRCRSGHGSSYRGLSQPALS